MLSGRRLPFCRPRSAQSSLYDAKAVDPEIADADFMRNNDRILKCPWQAVEPNAIEAMLDVVSCYNHGMRALWAPAVAKCTKIPMLAVGFYKMDMPAVDLSDV